VVIPGLDAVNRYSPAEFGLASIADRLHRIRLPALGLLVFLKSPCETTQMPLGLVTLDSRRSSALMPAFDGLR
jgi:hypothetical protein